MQSVRPFQFSVTTPREAGNSADSSRPARAPAADLPPRSGVSGLTAADLLPAGSEVLSSGAASRRTPSPDMRGDEGQVL